MDPHCTEMNANVQNINVPNLTVNLNTFSHTKPFSQHRTLMQRRFMRQWPLPWPLTLNNHP